MQIVVVGGGAAGTMVALQLLRRTSSVHVTVVDRQGAFGRGIAYARGEAHLRLNVPAVKMGGIGPDDPLAFDAWLAGRGVTLEPFERSFVARSLFGDFLHEGLAAGLVTGRLACATGEVMELGRDDTGRWRCTGPGFALAADAVVLCPGNPEPPRPAGTDDDPRFVADVWAPGALDRVRPGERIVILGSGATAIDAMLTLRARGHDRPITMISRRGLLPCVEVPPGAHPDFGAPLRGRSLRQLVRGVRNEVAAATRRGIPWQWVVDAWRTHAATTWQSLDLAERRRFLRHLRPWWMIHRHRLAPDLAARLDDDRRTGSLVLMAARLLAVTDDGPGCRLRLRGRADGVERDLDADRVLNCVGPSESFASLADPLMRQIFAAGIARPGALGLGIEVDDGLAVVGDDGRPHPDLFTIGLPTRGRFWEVSAVIHIRQQAEAVCALLADLARRADAPASIHAFEETSR